MSKTKKINHSADFLKFIFALAIVWLHVTAETMVSLDYDTFYNYHIYLPFLRMGVPYFFAITGYFMSKKRQENYPLIKAGQSFRLYVQLTLIYLVFDYLNGLVQAHLAGVSFLSASRSFLGDFSFMELINGTLGHSHLWYLWALTLGLLIFYWTRKKFNDHPTLLLLAILGHLLATSSPLNQTKIFRNGGFPEAFLFLRLGYQIGKYRPRLSKHWPWMVIGLILYFLSYYDALDGSHAIVQLLLTAVTAGLIIFIDQVQMPNQWVSEMGRRYSSSIYYFHNMGIALMPYLFKLLKIPEIAYMERSILTFILATLLSIPLGKLFNQLTE